MGKRENINPDEWSASRLNRAATCELMLERSLTEKRPPTFPLFVAGGAVHAAAKFAVMHQGFRRTEGRPCFFYTAESFHEWWWGHWGRFVARKEEKPGIRWRDKKKQFGSLGAWCAGVLTGLHGSGPKGQRRFKRVRKRSYFEMMTDPRLTFILLAAEIPFRVQFGRFTLMGTIDQIWEVPPYTPERGLPKFLPKGGIVIPDLTMGGGPIKFLQRVFYALAARLAVRQDPEFVEELFWDPEEEGLRYNLKEICRLFDEATTAVLSLSDAKLKIGRPKPEDFVDLRERLERGAVLARRIMRGEKLTANPTDSNCRMCVYNFDCPYAAVEEVLDLSTGGYDVLPSPEKEPELGKQGHFPGGKQGREVTQEVVRQPLVEMPQFSLEEAA